MVQKTETAVSPTWWMAPHAGAIALMLPLLTASWLASVEFHRELGRMAKYMDFGIYVSLSPASSASPAAPSSPRIPAQPRARSR